MISTSLIKAGSQIVSKHVGSERIVMYDVLTIQPQFWSDGSTGIQLRQFVNGRVTIDGFWLRVEEFDLMVQDFDWRDDNRASSK